MFVLDERLQGDTVFIGRFPLCQVLLMNDRRYPWVILVPAQSNVFEYYHLALKDRQQMMSESVWLAEKMADYFNADSMNVAALGNVVPQLHVHHVARFETDTAWPAPVWGHSAAEPYSEEEKQARVKEITQLLESHLISGDKVISEDTERDFIYW
ncbi:MAG: HIT domain-containing protein [Oleibacter sp.]|nr:HIT domain-containing protein [Thalassolituus sp.]